MFSSGSWTYASLSAAIALAALAPLAAHAAPIYSLTSTIAIPAATSNATGKFSGYDLSTFDPATQLFYVTDRSNNGVDVFSAKTNSFQARIGAGLFAGSTPSNDNAGPNGLTIANVSGGKLLIAGNGPSNLIAFSLGTDGVTVNGAPRIISTAVAGTAVPPNRVDGVAFAPGANTILAANNAANPGFLTLIDNATSAVRRSIVLDGTTVSSGTTKYPNVNGDGVEATIFNTVRGTYFVAVPVLNGAGSGGVIELDATSGNLLNTYDFNALGLTGICGPTGIAQGAGASMVVACGDPGTVGNLPKQTVVLDPAGQGSITTVTQIAGGDQVAYDPVRNVFFEATRYQPGGPILGIIDGATGLFSQSLAITANDHSVAVDPVSGEVYVPYGAGNTTCPNGCIAVFSPAGVPVPEPGSAPLVAAALAMLGLAAFTQRARRPATSARRARQ